MRLLKVANLDGEYDLPTIVEFLPHQIPDYAILSHRWHPNPLDEVQFGDLVTRDKELLQHKKGYWKLQSSCYQAWKDGLAYIWVIRGPIEPEICSYMLTSM